MGIPRKIKFGPVTFAVKVVKKIGTKGRLGETQNDQALILLRKSNASQEQVATLIHEALHGLFWTYGLAHIFMITFEDEERIIRLLAPALLGLIRDNPDLIEYLRGEE